MFVKLSHRDRLGCLADFVGMILLCLLPPFRKLRAPFRLQLPCPNCFFRVCFPTLFAAVLKFFLPLTTPAISSTANSNKSAPTRFAADDIFTQKRNSSSPENLCKSPKSPSPLSSNRSIVWNFYLS